MMVRRKNAATIASAPAFCPVLGDEAVTQGIKLIRQKFNVPAIAVTVVTNDEIKWYGRSRRSQTRDRNSGHTR